MISDSSFGTIAIKVEGENPRKELEILQSLGVVKWSSSAAPLDGSAFRRHIKMRYLVFWRFRNGEPNFSELLYSSDSEREIREGLDEVMNINDFVEKYFGLYAYEHDDEISVSSDDVLCLL